jgi:hypothetical protein
VKIKIDKAINSDGLKGKGDDEKEGVEWKVGTVEGGEKLDQ